MSMTPEDYLMQVKNIKLRVKALKGELKGAEALKDPAYAYLLRERIESDLLKYEKLELRIRDEIHEIEDNKLSALLIEYYVLGKSWEQVAEALGVKSIKNTRENLRAAALKAFAAKHPEYFFEKTP